MLKDLRIFLYAAVVALLLASDFSLAQAAENDEPCSQYGGK